jgi:4-hydroxy-tetrahydrodipicolinate synthase
LDKLQNNATHRPLKGIIPPLVTPLMNQDKLDHAGLERLIEHLISGGVHGLFILGTTGEGPSLSYDLRYEITERVCDQINERLPVLVGITDTSLSESAKLAEKAESLKADAVVAAPPYYFTNNQSELADYFHVLADRSPLPLFLYNMPSHTKVNIAAETVEKLSGHENIIGLKDSSGNLVYFQKVVRLMEDQHGFSLLVGPEELLMQSVISGAHGGVNGGANMFPKLYVKMYEAARSGHVDEMKRLQKIIMKISSTIYTVGNSPGSYLQGVKSALSVMGICSDVMALPGQSHSADEKKRVRKAIENLESEWKT